MARGYSAAMTISPAIEAVTLFVEDLESAKSFYTTVFDVRILFEDSTSAAYRFGNTVLNLLQVEAAPELVQPAIVARPEAGARAVFTVSVDDVDAVCEELRANGVDLINGPMDRPWGPRTASFSDPAGHLWEIAH